METKELRAIIELGENLMKLSDDQLINRIESTYDVINFIAEATEAFKNIEYRRGW